MDDITFLDTEFALKGEEKIDYKTILFKQIDFIRFLRTQDLGDYIVFSFNSNTTDEKLWLKWLQNSSMYQNAIKSLQNLITTYHDEEYQIKVDKIKVKYSNIRKEEAKKIINKYKNNSVQRINLLNLANKKNNIINTPKEYDEYFQECLMLIQRAKFIGGNDFIQERIKK